MEPNNSQHQIPELQDVAKKHVVEALEGKVERCYSKDRHDVFQDDVIRIVHRELAGDDGREKLKDWVVTIVKGVLIDQGVEKKKFIWPLILAGTGAIAGIGSFIVAIINGGN